MQKILLLASWYPTTDKPQSGVFIQQQAALLSQKYDVKVLVCNPTIVGRRGFAKQLFGETKKLENTNNVVDKNFELLEYNVKEYVFLNEEIRYKKIFASYLQYLQKLFATWKPNIIHAHDPLLAGVVANYISSNTHIPYVLTSHTPLFLNTRSSVINNLVLQCFTNANQIITVGNQDKRILESILTLKNKTLTLGNVLNTDNLIPKNKIESNPNSFKIVNITSTGLRKDIPTFLKSVKHYIDIYNQKLDLKVIMVVSEANDGYSLQQMSSDINSLGLQELISIKTDLTHSQIVEELSTTQLYISTSYYETFGLSVAEAIAFGIPTISVDNGAVTDFVTHNQNGLIVPMGDHKLIADYINKIAIKEIVFDEQKLHLSIADRYSQKQYLTNLTAVYNNILN